MPHAACQIRKFLRDERGATAVEYGLVIALIAVAIVVGAGAIGTRLNGNFQTLSDTLLPP